MPKTHRKPLSRFFPAYHPKAGQPTYFVEKVNNGLDGIDGFKYGINFLDMTVEHFKKLGIDYNKGITEKKVHTIRAGNKVKVGDFIKFYVWEGKPYRSKQIVIAPPIEVKKVWDISLHCEDDDGEHDWCFIKINNGKGLIPYSQQEYLSATLKNLALNDGFENPQDLWDWFEWDKFRNAKGEDYKPFIGQIICWSDSINY